jgi:hypothetical protein
MSEFRCGDIIRPIIAPNYIGMVIEEDTGNQEGKYKCRIVSLTTGSADAMPFNREYSIETLWGFEIEPCVLPWACPKMDLRPPVRQEKNEATESDPFAVGKSFVDALKRRTKNKPAVDWDWVTTVQWQMPADSPRYLTSGTSPGQRPAPSGVFTYERFTDRARKVMQLANQEAQRFNHEYIGTEHMLLGLVKDGGGVAASVLKNLDIDLRKVRLEVERFVQSGPDMVTMGKLPQTPRAKRVMDFSMEESRLLGCNYVGTEHLLLGLIREQEGVAGHVLRTLGVTYPEVKANIIQLLGLKPRVQGE